MKVVISSAGRFHTFDLARQMLDRGYLTRLYTAYPGFKVTNIARETISTYPWIMGAAELAARLGFVGLRDRMNFTVAESFDRWVASRIESCDVFHCLSSFGAKSHRAARERYGALTVCDRGSTHILFQNEILREEHEKFGFPYRPIDARIIERELAEYDFCDLVTVPSTFSLRSFLARGVPRAKLRLNPYGVDLSMFRQMPKRDTHFRVMLAGTLSLRKGAPYLIEAIRRAAIPELDFVHAGAIDPEITPMLSQMSVPLRHLGLLPRAQLADYYSQASALVLPSVEEGLALVMAQAMACGTPVIATENTGAEDLFTNGVEGFIVPIRDPDAIAQKLTYLYENPDARNAMGAAALTRVRALGGWNSYGDKMVKCYETALAARVSASSVRSCQA